MAVTVETKRRPPTRAIAREPASKPRPVGISTVMYHDTLITSVVYDDGSVWENERGEWSRLPRIPQGGV